MRKTILIYGLIQGVIISTLMVIMMSQLHSGSDFGGNEIVGYAGMILVFSLIFIGVRSYRNQSQDGFITFGKAFKMGALIALIASTIYVVTWLFYYYLFIPDFMDIYIPHAMEQAAESGATQVELDEKSIQMEQFKQMYKNPLFVILITYTEILPVGLLVALVTAFILKRKSKGMVSAAG